MIRLAFAGIVALAGASVALADSTIATDTVELMLKDHRFTPEVIRITAGQRVRFHLSNEDPTRDDFESRDLHLDKEVAGGGIISFFVGPLTPGTYAFKTEKNAATAHGTIEVTAAGQRQ